MILLKQYTVQLEFPLSFAAVLRISEHFLLWINLGTIFIYTT